MLCSAIVAQQSPRWRLHLETLGRTLPLLKSALILKNKPDIENSTTNLTYELNELIYKYSEGNVDDAVNEWMGENWKRKLERELEDVERCWATRNIATRDELGDD